MNNTHRFAAPGLTNYEITPWRKAEADGRRLNWRHCWAFTGKPVHFTSKEQWELWKAHVDRED